MAEIIDLSNPEVFHSALEPVADKLLTRHLNTAKEWFPHELVPYSLGETFGKGYEWSESESTVKDPAVRAALFVNLLTEDNLPYYFRDIQRMFGMDGAFGTWNKRWTAEEGRHSIAIRDYLIATRAVDPIQLERARMAQVSGGETPSPESPLVGCVYVSLQELATRIAHRNTGNRLPDDSGKEVMKKVANDENLHYLFYKDLAKAAIQIDPSSMVIAMKEVVENFEMPGTGIIDFDAHSKRIAYSGIFGMNELVHDVFNPVIDKQWNVWNLENLSPAAEVAREGLAKVLEIKSRVARIEKSKREKYKKESTDVA